MRTCQLELPDLYKKQPLTLDRIRAKVVLSGHDYNRIKWGRLRVDTLCGSERTKCNGNVMDDQMSWLATVARDLSTKDDDI